MHFMQYDFNTGPGNMLIAMTDEESRNIKRLISETDIPSLPRYNTLRTLFDAIPRILDGFIPAAPDGASDDTHIIGGLATPRITRYLILLGQCANMKTCPDASTLIALLNLPGYHHHETHVSIDDHGNITAEILTVENPDWNDPERLHNQIKSMLEKDKPSMNAIAERLREQGYDAHAYDLLEH